MFQEIDFKTIKCPIWFPPETIIAFDYIDGTVLLVEAKLRPCREFIGNRALIKNESGQFELLLVSPETPPKMAGYQFIAIIHSYEFVEEAAA